MTFLNLTFPNKGPLRRLVFSPTDIKTLLGFASTHQLSQHNRPTPIELLTLMNSLSSCNALDCITPDTINILAGRIAMAIDRRLAKIITTQEWVFQGDAVVWPKWTEGWIEKGWNGVVTPPPKTGNGVEGRQVVEARHSMGITKLGHQVEGLVRGMRILLVRTLTSKKENDIVSLKQKEMLLKETQSKERQDSPSSATSPEADAPSSSTTSPEAADAPSSSTSLEAHTPSSSFPSQEADDRLRKAFEIYNQLQSASKTTHNKNNKPAAVTPISHRGENDTTPSNVEQDFAFKQEDEYSADSSRDEYSDDSSSNDKEIPSTLIKHNYPLRSTKINSTPQPASEPSVYSDEDSPEPLAIVGSRVVNKKMQCAVKWDDGIATWEDTIKMTENFPELVEKWYTLGRGETVVE